MRNLRLPGINKTRWIAQKKVHPSGESTGLPEGLKALSTLFMSTFSQNPFDPNRPFLSWCVFLQIIHLETESFLFQSGLDSRRWLAERIIHDTTLRSRLSCREKCHSCHHELPSWPVRLSQSRQSRIKRTRESSV